MTFKKSQPTTGQIITLITLKIFTPTESGIIPAYLAFGTQLPFKLYDIDANQAMEWARYHEALYKRPNDKIVDVGYFSFKIWADVLASWGILHDAQNDVGEGCLVDHLAYSFLDPYLRVQGNQLVSPTNCIRLPRSKKRSKDVLLLSV
jgi:hypothetical protein